MSPSAPEAAPPRLRPTATLAFMAAPIVAGLLLLAGTVGWYLTVMGTSGAASGKLARLRFESACAAEAGPVLERRLQEFGLEPKAEDGLAFVVRTPGLPDDLEHLPLALTRPGTLEVVADGQPRDVKIANVGVQLAFSGTPVTLIMLVDAVSDEGVAVRIDGELVQMESQSGLELQAAARGVDSTTALRLATDRAVSLRHPLPCPVTPGVAEWVAE